MRKVALLTISALGALSLSLAVACGGGADPSTTSQGGSVPMANVETARSLIAQMVSAAEGGDREAAEVAFASAHDALHELIEALRDTDATLAAELEGMVYRVEIALAVGAEADHVSDDAKEIGNLLEATAAVLGADPMPNAPSDDRRDRDY